MKFCSHCGASVRFRVPEGDNRERFVCVNCNSIHYANPKIIAGCLPVWNEKILLCKRAIEPKMGYWTLPAGFMENHESTLEAACRETWEEANAEICNPELFSIFSIPHISQVYILFRGTLKDGKAYAGDESLEVRLFPYSEIPWDQIAFDVIKESLKLYYNDLNKGKFSIHTGDIIRIPDQGFSITYY